MDTINSKIFQVSRLMTLTYKIKIYKIIFMAFFLAFLEICQKTNKIFIIIHKKIQQKQKKNKKKF